MARLPRLDPPRVLPGKERGKHAGYDAEGRELVYIGLEGMTMHRDVLELLAREWERCFSDDGTGGGTS